MMRLVLLSVLLSAAGVARAQTMSRAELKKPLSDTVEKALAELVERCVPEKQKQLTVHMKDVITSMGSTAKLTADESKALDEASASAIATSLKAWQPLAIVMMRTYLTRTSEAGALRHIAMWKPELAGPNEPVEGWIPPDELPEWLAAVKSTLGETRFNTWRASDLAKKKKADAEIAAYLERWVGESRGPMHQDLTARIELMKEKLELPEVQVAALKKAADALLDKLANDEVKRASGMLRSLPVEARQSLMGRSYFYIRFDRPRGEAWDKAWSSAASGVLSKDLIARWQTIEYEERDKALGELEDMIKPSEQQAEQRMEMAMAAEIDSITTSLSLSKDRQTKLEELSKAAIQESLKVARKGWLLQARNYSAEERKRIRGNVYFGISDEQQAMELPIWKEGLKKILSEEERVRMEAENKDREKRTVGSLARACLAEMDETLALNSAQRSMLEPMIEELMLPLMEQRQQQYWSYNPTQLFQASGKASEQKVRAILDEIQWKHWQKLVTPTSNSSRNADPDINDSGPEVSDVEAAISAHLYQMFVEERERMLAAMMPNVEDATRVLSLSKPTAARLTTAAKGAVEQNMASWRQTLERYVRSSIASATSKNILQALAGSRRVSFSRNENAAQDTELWRTALTTTLTPAQLKQLQQVVDARQDYRLRAMAAMTVTELDRRRRLTQEQCAKLEPLIRGVIAEYLPDIERYMSQNWFLQYYYALVPLAGVAEKDLQAILTPEQTKLCKERDLPDAIQYWEGIKSNHDQRVKNGGNAIRDRVIWNKGIMIDQ